MRSLRLARVSRLTLAGVLVLSTSIVGAGAARAQSPAPGTPASEDEWGQLPNKTPANPPPVEAPPPPPPDVGPPPTPPGNTPSFTPASSGPLRPRSEVLARVRPPEERNSISMVGATSLGSLNRGEMVLLGFPLLQLRFMLGLGDRFDLGLGFDSYYFMMNEPRLVTRVNLVKGENFALGLTLEGGYAFFTQRASREQRGARWLTGRRNINVSPAVVGSYQASTPRAARLFFELRYLLALDTEPFATDPLTGVPPAVVPGHNFTLKGGAELPLSSKTAFVLVFGFDVHGRATDSVVMPSASLGLVTSL